MELAARIGQTLLEKNKVYEDKNETLEELLAQANERVGGWCCENKRRHSQQFFICIRMVTCPFTLSISGET